MLWVVPVLPSCHCHNVSVMIMTTAAQTGQQYTEYNTSKPLHGQGEMSTITLSAHGSGVQ